MRRASFVAFAIGSALVVLSSRAHAYDRPVISRFETITALGFRHARVFDTRIELADVRLGIGYVSKVPHGGGAEIMGTLGAQLGVTERGRATTGLTLVGVAIVLHYDWLRLGFGAEAGSLATKRSTGGDSLHYAIGDVWVSTGVEPIAISGRPVFLDGRFTWSTWGSVPMTSFGLSLGIRWCGEECAGR